MRRLWRLAARQPDLRRVCCSSGMAEHGALLDAIALQISPATAAADLTAFSGLLAGMPAAAAGIACPARADVRAAAAQPLLDVATAQHRLSMTSELLQPARAAALAG